MDKTDMRLKKDVEDELEWEPKVNAGDAPSRWQLERRLLAYRV